MLIDIDSGTIVHGPIFFLDDEWAPYLEELPDSDIIGFAQNHGTVVTR